MHFKTCISLLMWVTWMFILCRQRRPRSQGSTGAPLFRVCAVCRICVKVLLSCITFITSKMCVWFVLSFQVYIMSHRTSVYLNFDLFFRNIFRSLSKLLELRYSLKILLFGPYVFIKQAAFANWFKCGSLAGKGHHFKHCILLCWQHCIRISLHCFSEG